MVSSAGQVSFSFNLSHICVSRLSRCHMHMFLHLHSKQILFTSQSAGTLACLVQLTL